MKVIQATDTHGEMLDGVNALLPQLSRTARPLSETEFLGIIASDSARILLAVDGERLCGMLTLVTFRIPTGVRSWIEDVVVNEADRGRGVAKALLEAAIELARSHGAKTLDLTSRPSREAANRLYAKVGFVKRETNVYRVAL